MCYPVVTNRALCDFNDAMKEFKKNHDKPIVLGREIAGKVETVSIYQPDSGMVPHYTGHIPGKMLLFMPHS